MNELPVYEECPILPEHDFWLLREEEYTYKDYRPFLGREDSPIKIPDNTLAILSTGLQWAPSVNPSSPTKWCGYGFNKYGPTVINREGGATWAQVLRGWAQIFRSGPATLRIPVGLIYVHLGETDADTETIKAATGSPIQFENPAEAPAPHRHILLIDRDPFVANLKTLAEWGDKAATGEYFILHLGI